MQITQNNYKLIAAKLYRNPVFSDQEFESDLSLIRRVVGKIGKFALTGIFPTNLVVNNFIIACNCFGSNFVINCMFLLSDENYYDLIKTFIEVVSNVEVRTIKVNDKRFCLSEIQFNESFFKKIKEDLK
jgi:hypothetical protein